MTSRGDKVVYRCLAGYRYDAKVVAVRPDGRLDLAVDVGCNEPNQLTRIEFDEEAAPGGYLRAGTCGKP